MCRELRRYFILTFIGSWSAWFFAILKSYDVIDIPVSKDIIKDFGAFSPSIIGLLFIYYYKGKDKLVKVLKSVWPKDFKIGHYLYLFLLMPAALFVSYMVASNIFNIKYNLPLFEKPLIILIVFIYILFLGGPLGEEFGWRGYALDKLLSIYKPIKSSIILGVIWALWHIPLFFIKGTVQQDINFIGYILYTILLSILITTIFIKTNKSMFSALMFHTMSNLSLGLFPIFMTITGGIVTMISIIIITIIVMVYRNNYSFS